MGNVGHYPIHSFGDKYIIALYFVTTTVTTCGFGDISASDHDSTEAGVIIIMQFIGLLFYSMTI
jgi:hypothetical protein